MFDLLLAAKVLAFMLRETVLSPLSSTLLFRPLESTDTYLRNQIIIHMGHR